MATSLSDRRGTPHSPGLETFHGWSLIHRNFFDVKPIDINSLFLSGIGNGRF